MVIDLAAEPADLEQLITTKTAECEGIEPWGQHFANVVAVRVLSVEPLAKGKNKRVIIESGGAKHVVVCGAPNVKPNLIAAWVPPGTKLGGKEIGVATIEGVESEGMLASGDELGINRDDSGLLEINAAPGQSLTGLAQDWIIEIDNKSLTHRPDLWGHYGMAREVAAITAGTLADPVRLDRIPRGEPRLSVAIENYELCARYSALLLDSITVGPSPLWLQARLQSIGIHPINNVVDVTNYILAELPQPMHAFDADKLRGGKIIVRRAIDGEAINALNGETYQLSPEDLVIADGGGAIAIAGVIGGSETAISEATTRVVLESANFLASSVRLTSARHKLRTDASMRFEKSLDPENTVRGLARAMELLELVSPGVREVGGIADNRAKRKISEPIALPVSFVVRKLGKDLSNTRIREILESLGFGVRQSSPGNLMVDVPSWRATKDVSLKDDLVEEVGRIVGYGEITPAAPLLPAVTPPENPMRKYLRQVRSQLAAQGLTEVYNYSFVNEAQLRRFQMDVEDHIAVANPIASELTHMRTSLLPGVFDNIVSNTRHLRDFRFFEIGREIHGNSGDSLPREETHVAAVIYGAHADEQDFFELKRVMECLLPGARLRPAAAKAYEHPARTAEIEWLGRPVGRLFELHPLLLQEAGIEGRASLFDVDLDVTQTLANRPVKYKPIRRYPTSGFDLSIVTELRQPVAAIQDTLASLAGDALVCIEFVRQYAGAPLEEGKKSVSYRLEVGATDHTLSNEEFSEIRGRIIDRMQAQGYELRV
jgi:phenylalanyl-tRNA synthetase beta chain